MAGWLQHPHGRKVAFGLLSTWVFANQSWISKLPRLTDGQRWPFYLPELWWRRGLWIRLAWWRPACLGDERELLDETLHREVSQCWMCIKYYNTYNDLFVVILTNAILDAEWSKYWEVTIGGSPCFYMLPSKLCTHLYRLLPIFSDSTSTLAIDPDATTPLWWVPWTSL